MGPYVHPSVCFGLEFIPAGPQTARFQTRVLLWGRRLLGWPQGSPSLAVQAGRATRPSKLSLAKRGRGADDVAWELQDRLSREREAGHRAGHQRRRWAGVGAGSVASLIHPFCELIYGRGMAWDGAGVPDTAQDRL